MNCDFSIDLEGFLIVECISLFRLFALIFELIISMDTTGITFIEGAFIKIKSKSK
ncbi:MAG TPA: hypothetical protein PLV78_02720 [Deltaproteobacteria bacterium]|nr:hypothetical protein [Deltaproteobacteria bacterium]